MSLTIGLVNHDYGRYLRQAIDAALLEADEVIVSDDASTDESQDIIRSYGSAIRSFLHKENDGRFMRGANDIIGSASCEWCAFLSSDDFVLPGFSELCLPDFDWVYCDLALQEGGNSAGSWRYGGWPTDWESAIKHARDTLSVGLPHIGVQRTSWIRANGLRWSQLPSTQIGDDAYTVSLWLKAKPRIAYVARELMVYRQHSESYSHLHASEEALFRREFAQTLGDE